jgi:hypothetical protein
MMERRMQTASNDGRTCFVAVKSRHEVAHCHLQLLGRQVKIKQASAFANQPNVLTVSTSDVFDLILERRELIF